MVSPGGSSSVIWHIPSYSGGVLQFRVGTNPVKPWPSYTAATFRAKTGYFKPGPPSTLKGK